MLAAGSLTSNAAPGSAGTAPQLYRRFFTPAECQALDAAPAGSVLSEISLLRILLTRVFAVARQQTQRSRATLVQLLSMLAGFSHAAMIIASLARFEQKHSASGSESDPNVAALAQMDPNGL
jgi:hypothetical protein